jgi:hypothetical protein
MSKYYLVSISATFSDISMSESFADTVTLLENQPMYNVRKKRKTNL